MGKSLLKIAILAVFFVPFAMQIVSPGIQLIAEAFPGVAFTTIALIITLPSLMTIPFSMISGKIAGTVVSTKTVAVIGLVLFVVAGISPYFFSSLTAVLISRAIFGIGVGVLVPLGATLVFSFIQNEEERGSLMGLGTVTMNAGGIVYALLGGWVAVFGWKYIFLVHLIGVVLLVLVILFLPNQPVVKAQKAGTGDVPAVKDKLPLTAYGVMFLSFLLCMLFYPVLVNMSGVIINENIGTAAAAGIVITMYTVGGMIGGAAYGKLSPVAKGMTIPLALTIIAVGFALLGFGGTLILLGIGTALCGVGFGIYFPDFYMLVGKASKPTVVAFGMSLVMAGFNIGAFLSPYFYAFLAQVTGQTGLRFPFIFAMVSYVIIAVILSFILNKKPSEKTA